LQAIHQTGHEAEIAAIPFKWYPSRCIVDAMLACRLLDPSESCGIKVDRLIGLKFPAYLMPHPDKVLWLLHQYRDAYDLWNNQYCGLTGDPSGLQVRDSIIHADNQTFAEGQKIFTISKNVSKRMQKFNGVDSVPLYHPPQNADLFYCEGEREYLFFPSRLNPLKRQELVLQALAETRNPVKILFGGKAEAEFYFQTLTELADKLGVSDRVTFLGCIEEREKIQYYAQSLGVVFPPFDEDYGYVTLEAMLSSKPVITCTDSGGPLEFVRDGETGSIAEPTPAALAVAMDRLWENRDRAAQMGKAAREYYAAFDISWSNVISKLLA
jgi:glycosyltransferase involved in cell wall biosynthesis